MRKAKHILALATIATIPMAASSALAATYTWNGSTGTQNWTTGWTSGYPNAPLDVAIIPDTLTGNLNINMDAPGILSSLTFGSAFTTDIGNGGSTTNTLTFDNTTTGATPANGVITVTGTGTNIISAPVIITGTSNGQNTVAGATSFDIAAASTAALTINGSITNAPAVGTQITAPGTGTTGTHALNNLSTKDLTLNGAINLTTATDTAGRAFSLGTTSGGGRIIINGNINNGGTAGTSSLTLGSTSTSNTYVYPTIQVNSSNTPLTANVSVQRVKLELGGVTNPLGTGVVTLTGSANIIGGPTVSATNGPVTLGNSRLAMNQFVNFTGANSITFSGALQGFTATRGLTNDIDPATGTLTFGGDFYSNNNSTNGDVRVMAFAGRGNTVIQGTPIYSYVTTGIISPSNSASLDMRGTGTLTINGSGNPAAVNGTDPVPVRYQGSTRVRSGLLQFANYLAMSGTSGATVEAGGAFGLLSGSIAGPDSAAFLGKLATGSGTLGNSATGPTSDPNTSYGAIALASADSAATVDFTSGPLANANLNKMGIGAVSTGVTFTGSIIPANSTYKLGGGGKLTLPNAQLSGANNVLLDNGGTTALGGANTYTGTTTVGGNYTNPFQAVAVQGQQNSVIARPASVRTNSTLEVSSLANGGSASSIGSSSSAASSLVLNGGTLKYTGTGSNTDRLFTVSSNGATLDASGTGAVNFTNTGAIVAADAAVRTGTVDAGTPTFVAVSDVSDLAVGMAVTGTGVLGTPTILSIHPAVTSGNFTGGPSAQRYYVQLSTAQTPSTIISDLAFSSAARTLALTGTSTAANTISGALSNAAGGGALGITKTGAGTWALAGTNTYTGATTVTAGTLAVNTPASIASGSAVTVGGGTSAAVYKIGWNGVASSATIALPTLSTNGKFDIAQGRVVLTNKTPAEVAALVGNGAAGTGTIFTSSFGGGHAVGFGDVGAGGTTVRYTFQGDADLNGTVNFNDFLVLQNNFGSAGVFSQGDFDYNGTVNFNDFLALQNNFGSSVAGVAVNLTASQVAAMTSFAATVPEPTSLALLGLGAAAALRRRKAR